MGNYQKYLPNLYQSFTDIKAVKVMDVYQILVIYLIPEKNNGKKVCFKGNLKRLVEVTLFYASITHYHCFRATVLSLWVLTLRTLPYTQVHLF
jgi:hypothetical protein